MPDTENPTPARTQERLLGLAGVAGLFLGAGPLAAVPFGLSLRSMESRWRQKRSFSGTFAERWAHAIVHYEGTHQHPVNRALHVAGTPAVVAGTLGLAVSSPFVPLTWPIWGPSAAAFTLGWASNLVGHAVFERNPPAFADDPWSFLAGPMWEIDLLRKQLAGERAPA